MARYIVITPASVGTAPNTVRYEKGWTGELSSAQVSAITSAGGAVRTVNSPGAVQTTTYPGGATSSYGIPPGSPTHDTAGEAAGAAN